MSGRRRSLRLKTWVEMDLITYIIRHAPAATDEKKASVGKEIRMKSIAGDC